MSKYRFTLFSSLLLLFYFKSNAQSISADTLSKSKKEFSIPSLAKDFIHDEGKIYTSPFRIKNKDLKIVLPALAITGSLFFFDHSINNEAKKLVYHNPMLHNAGNAITNGGEPIFTGGLAITFLASGLIFNNPQAKETGLLAGEALVHTIIATTITKSIFGRERPSAENEEGAFEFSVESIKSSAHNSFPSGHSSTVWALATVIATEYKDVKWIPYLCYSSASLVSLSRVVLHKHWSADVFAGGLLGYGIGRLVIKEHNKKWHLTPTSSLSGEPAFLFTMRF